VTRWSAPAWDEIPEETREAVASAALAMLTHTDPGDDWLGTKTLPYAVIAGREAFQWLFRYRHPTITAQGGDLWTKWLCSLLTEDTSTDEELLAELFQEAIQRLPEDDVHEVLGIIVERGCLSDTSIRRRVVRHFWDEWLEDRLRAEVMKPSLQADVREDLLTDLLVKEEALPSSLVKQWIETPEENPERRLTAARAWLAARSVEAWPNVNQAMQADTAFGTTLIEGLASWTRQRMTSALEDGQLGELLSWLLARYPPDDDPRLGADGATSVHPRLRVVWWREELLKELKQRGTIAAVRAIEGLLAEHPRQTWLKLTLRDALEQRSARTWQPPAPGEVIQILDGSREPMLRSDAELQALVLDALKDLQQRAIDDPTVAQHYWESWTDGKSTKRKPKDELSCSEELRLDLQPVLRAGAALGPLREVRIRQARAGAPAQHADLEVVAITRTNTEETEELHVRVEVKGIWHPKVRSDMDEQLFSRYLLGGEAIHHHGVYLVCWFDQDSWDNSDSRRRAQARRSFSTIEEARELLELQALKLNDRSEAHIEAFVLDLSLAKPAARQ
jgi:hypothetical protein